MGEEATEPEPEETTAPPPRFARAREVYVRALGLVFLIAFASLYVQVDGLIGSRGVLPLAEYLPLVEEHFGGRDWLRFPCLFWLGTSDAFLEGACLLGMAAALLPILGIFPGPSLLAAWFVYLGFVHGGQAFLSFQWDTLLLEAGLLGVLVAPWGLRPRPGSWPDPGPAAAWLGRVLLFKLMFQAGVVKLASGDETWWGLTALEVHYETQPLPTPLAWYVHQLPGWFQQLSCALALGIELVLPFAIFMGRRARWVAAAGFVGLMGLISLTGNYTFFNLLTALLCVWLFEDRNEEDEPEQDHPRRRRGTWGLVAIYSLLCLLQVHGSFVGRGARPALTETLLGPLRPFLSVNSYGLFARMTTTRPEIELQGSMDGTTWKSYVFRWKPGALDRRPGWNTPHQPRLDWQMWFAALGPYQRSPWFLALAKRLAERSPPVLALIEEEPFPGKSPRYLRALLHRYRFTRSGTSEAERDWWTRETLGLFCPPLERRMR